MCCISIDRLVEGEIGRIVVIGLVQRRVGSWIRASETPNPFLKVSFTLGSGYGTSCTVVVIECL